MTRPEGEPAPYVPVVPLPDAARDERRRLYRATEHERVTRRQLRPGQGYRSAGRSNEWLYQLQLLR